MADTIEVDRAMLTAANLGQGAPAQAEARLRLRARGTRYQSAQTYLGHRNIQHTARYTELSPTRFEDFWRAPILVMRHILLTGGGFS
jgi:hypothetical protein